MNAVTACDLLHGFKQKLLLFGRRMPQKNVANFSFLNKVILDYSNLDLVGNAKAGISQHLE